LYATRQRDATMSHIRDERRFLLAALLHPYRGVFRTLSLILSCFSACLIPFYSLFSLDLALFFPLSSVICCLFLFRLVSLDGAFTRSKTCTINSPMKSSKRANLSRDYTDESSHDRLSALKESQCLTSSER